MSSSEAQYGFVHLPSVDVKVEYLQFGGRVLPSAVSSVAQSSKEEFSPVLTPHTGSSPMSESGPAATAPVKRIFFFTPGNPGLVHFYETFLRLVQEKLPNVGVVAFGLSGHSSVPRNGFRTFSLQEQIEHRRALVEKLSELHPEAKIHFCGHSIGAYMCQQLLRQHLVLENKLSLEPAHSFMLFPALAHLKKQGGSIRVWSLPGVRHVLSGIVGGFCSVVPFSAKSWIVRKFGPPAPDCPGSAAHLMSCRMIANILYLVRTEFDTVFDLDCDTVQQAHDVSYYYAVKDRWVPPDHYADMVGRVGAERAILDPHGCEHAFSLTQSHIVADFVVKRLHELGQSE
jgi:pimeloyl-ACP methyl ester carboxylesterase